MVTGAEVQEAVYNFMLTAFGGDKLPRPSQERLSEAIALMAAHRTLRADSAAAWPPETRAAAFEWLSRLVTFVTLFPELSFPPGFLHGTTSGRLGEPVIAYILQYQVELAVLDPDRRGPTAE